MHNLLFKKKPLKQENFTFKNKKLTIQDIEKFYLFKNNFSSKIGLEYERIALDKNTLKNASYLSMNRILKTFCDAYYWKPIFDDNVLIGAKSDEGSSISLEPGCQLEISLAPSENIINIACELNKIIETLDKIALVYDVIFIGYGISPKVGYEEIELLNKRRYKIMDKYLPYCSYGEFSPKMMRKTAGIQINIDFFNYKDAYLKLKFLNLIMPFVSGLCSNSPIENNQLTEFKSARSNVWLYTGIERCNSFYKNMFKKLFKNYNNVFKDYINCILNVPMIYIEREEQIIALNGKMNFKTFLNNGFGDYKATMDDYILQQSLCFPDVRLKNYIEIRNHDSSNPNIALALCAFYKGLFLNNITGLLNSFDFLKIDELEKYNKLVVKNGLDFKINAKISAWDVVEKLCEYSKNQLNSKERMFLEPLINFINNRKTQADEIIESGISDAKQLVEYLLY